MTEVSREQRRENLAKLATYLETLPADYDRFDMGTYLSRPVRSHATKTLRQYLLTNGGMHACGSVGCAIGHGPAAGILFAKSMIDDLGAVYWSKYVHNFVEAEFNPAYDWMFHADWKRRDNTPHGAAARIRYYLEHGIPEDFHAEYDLRLLEKNENDDRPDWKPTYAVYLITNQEK